MRVVVGKLKLREESSKTNLFSGWKDFHRTESLHGGVPVPSLTCGSSRDGDLT